MHGGAVQIRIVSLLKGQSCKTGLTSGELEAVTGFGNGELALPIALPGKIIYLIHLSCK